MKTIDILIKNGHVIDPAAGMDCVASIGIKNGKSVGVVSPDADAEVVVNANGHYVFPGLVDYHTHIFHRGSSLSIDPNCLIPMGVTTAADAGTTGCANFPIFNSAVVPNSSVRIFSILSLCSYGQPGDGIQEDFDPDKFNVRMIGRLVKEHPEQIKGLKIRMGVETVNGLGLEPMRRAKELSREFGVPLVVHASNPPVPEAELLELLESGDVMCHCYHGKGPHTILDENDKIRAEVWAARERGVVFDCANGHTNYNHHVAKKAIEDGFLPDVISTDICCHNFNLVGYAKNLPFVMSKYLTLGMSMADVVRAVTETPAKLLGMEGKIGTLAPGAWGDLVVCKQVAAAIPYLDNNKDIMVGDDMLVPTMTIKGGEILFRQSDF